MIVTLHLEKEHLFLNQVRRIFVFPKGSRLTGDLRLFASSWPFGVIEHEYPGRLGVEFTFSDDGKHWLYRGYIDSRQLWPASGSCVEPSPGSEPFAVGPLGGMRDDREDYHYLLPDGSERRFRLKYVGFQCWISIRETTLNLKLRHFLPGDDYVVIRYSIPTEDILFRPEDRLSYDAEGFLEDAGESRPFVRVEACAL
jgi:hypothetical protein